MPYKTDLPELSDKQHEILDLVYKFRFINRHQLQKIFNYKDPRRLNAWLKDLVEKKYLGRIYSHKLLENTKPAIYYLANNGITWVKWNKGRNGDDLETNQIKKFYQDKSASQTFIDHCIKLCNIYLVLKEQEKKTDWHYEITTKTEHWIETQKEERLEDMKDYIPDAYIFKDKEVGKDGIEIQTYFLELFDSHAPMYYLRYKVNQYMKFYDDEDLWDLYQNSERKCPTILFIFPTQQKLNRIAKYLQEQLENSYDVEDLIFKLTTYDKLMTEGLERKIWRIVTEK